MKLSVRCGKCEEKVGDQYSFPRASDEESSRPPFEINRHLLNSFLIIGTGRSVMHILA